MAGEVVESTFEDAAEYIGGDLKAIIFWKESLCCYPMYPRCRMLLSATD